MPIKLTLKGRVQGVFCRNYCSEYARQLNIHGSASNQSDGTVHVILNTDDSELIRRYIFCLLNNPMDFQFYGKIVTVDQQDHSEQTSGDYVF